jgi:cytochrome c biogenesis protein CcmG/thiol:disulfide interchange protein DsbE
VPRGTYDSPRLRSCGRAGAARLFVVIAGLFVTSLINPPLLRAGVPGNSLVGKQAPRFVRTDLAGRKIELKSYRGKVVLLNFWATWCVPCRVELPRFAGWQRQYGSQGLEIIAVSMDDDVTPVRATVRKLELNFPALMGDEKIGRQYGGVLGLPVTYLIGRDGIIRQRLEGETDLGELESTVIKLLAGK